LHKDKKYRKETLFMACTIFDRYLIKIGHWNFPRSNILKLSLVSLLLAAKIEEPIQPSFDIMIKMLDQEE
jgi:hypothetical protein